MAQFIVIVQILITERNAMDALSEQRFDAVLDPVLPAPVREAGRRLPGATTARLRSRSSRRRRTPL